MESTFPLPTFLPYDWLPPTDLSQRRNGLLIGWMSQEFPINLTKGPKWAHLCLIYPGTSTLERVVALQWP